MGDTNTFTRRINIYIDSGQAQQAQDKLLAQQAEVNKKIAEYIAKGKEVPEKLTKQLAEVTAQLDRQAKKISGELSPSYKELSSTVSKLTNELKGMTKEDNPALYAKKVEQLGKAKAALNEYGIAIGVVKKELQGNASDVPFLGKFGDTISALSGKLPSLGSAFKALWAIVIANPIIALGAALFGLFNLLKQNAEVADFLKFVTGGLSKVFGQLIDDAVEMIKLFGGKFMDALRNPRQLIKELGDLIKENLINRFKGFGELFAALADGDLKRAGNALLQIGTGVTNLTGKVDAAINSLQKYGEKLADVAGEGFEADKALDDLVALQGKYGLEIAKNNREIAKQETIYKDATRSAQERITAIDKLIKLEARNTDLRVSLAQKEYDAEVLKTKGRTLSSEEQKKLFDLEAAIVAARQQQEDNTRKAANKRLDLIQQMAEDELNIKMKLAEDLDKLGKKQLSDADKNNREALTQIDESFAAIKAQLLKAKEEQGASENEYRSEQLALDLKQKEARLAYLKEYATGSDESDKAIAQAKKEVADSELAYHQYILNEKTSAAKKQGEEELKLKEEQSAMLKDRLAKDNAEIINYANQTLTFLSTINAFLNQQENQELAKDKKRNKERADDLKKQLDSKKISQKQYQTAIDNMNKEADRKAHEIAVKQFKRNQAIQIVQAVVNTASAVMNAFATSGNIYAAIALAAVAAATGAAQIAIIASAKPPEMAEGGEVIGPSHADGGVPVVMEGGEFVVKNGPSQKYRGLLQMINSEPRSLNVGRAQENMQYAEGGVVRRMVVNDYRPFEGVSGANRGNSSELNILTREVRNLTIEVNRMKDKRVVLVKDDQQLFEENQKVIFKRSI